MKQSRIRTTAAALLYTLVAPLLAADNPLTPWAGSSGPQPPAPWHISGLPHQRKPFTQFRIEDWHGQHALRIEADRSYGNLVHLLPAGQAGHHLAWSWTLDEPNTLADLHTRSGEDEALRVCVLFDLPHDHLPLLERALLAMAHTDGGDPVPGATVCYVWDSRLPPGTALSSPYTRRIRMLVLRGPEAPLHQWASESRDIAADFRQLFGEEADVVPPLIGVAVGADADNTQAHSLAHLGSVSLTP
jgi:hypothetical protein